MEAHEQAEGHDAGTTSVVPHQHLITLSFTLPFTLLFQGAFPEDDGDSDDEPVFGDDAFDEMNGW